MSNIVHKVKDALSPNKDSHDTTTGTHSSSTGTHGTTGGYGGSTNAGPHSSNIANTADPRVDSDLSGGSHLGANQTTYSSGQPAGGLSGGHGGSTNAGPHSSNLANTADPRVDSDLSSGRGGYGSHTTGTGIGSGTTGTGYGSSTTGGYGSGTTGSSTTAGPHSSNLANKADPRVDSDLDGGRHLGANQTTYSSGQPAGGLSGGHGGSTNAGPHSSNIANTADPRVDSDLSSSRTGGTHGTGAGYGSGTGLTGSAGSGNSDNAGPHNSNLLNKLDPRVDSNQDGSKTFGGDATHR